VRAVDDKDISDLDFEKDIAASISLFEVSLSSHALHRIGGAQELQVSVI
jgi:hypothetical protein